MFEVPHQIAGHDQIERFIRKRKVLRVALPYNNRDVSFGGIPRGALQHPFRIVEGDHGMPQPGQQDGKESWPASYVQNV